MRNIEDEPRIDDLGAQYNIGTGYCGCLFKLMSEIKIFPLSSSGNAA
jgi:hypothetical protein